MCISNILTPIKYTCPIIPKWAKCACSVILVQLFRQKNVWRHVFGTSQLYHISDINLGFLRLLANMDFVQEKPKRSEEQAVAASEPLAKRPRGAPPSPAIGGNSMGSGLFSAPSHSQPLAIVTAPVRPVKAAPRSEWLAYQIALSTYVHENLEAELKKSCGLNIEEFGGLHKVPPTNIEKNAGPAIGGAQLTTYKETWNVERCIQSMQTTGKYSAAGSLWWFNLHGGAVMFQGQQVFEAEASSAGVDAASQLWDATTFLGSDSVEHRRRFNFPGTLPTACVGLPDAEQKLKIKGYEDAPTFKNLPLVAGRPVAIALLEAMAACMQSAKPEAKTRLQKLFEARGPL